MYESVHSIRSRRQSFMRMFQRFLLIPLVCAVAFMVQGLTGSIASAAYDLTQGGVQYTSLDSWGDEQTYTMTYESVPRFGVYANNAPHGAYLVHNDIDGGSNDFSYDYDGGTYTIYMGDGVTQKISYDAANNAMYVEDLLDDADSGTYTYDDETTHYENYESGHSILTQVAALITSGYSLGDTYTAYTAANGDRDFTIIEYPEEQSASNLPENWYKLTDDSNPDKWVAFTYNESNGVYTMYDAGDDSVIEKYSYRRFLDDNTLQVLDVGSSGAGAESGTYTKADDGKFYGDGTWISQYITDGMLLFRHECLE